MSGKTSYCVKPFIETEQIAATPTSLSNPTTPLSSAPKESRVFAKSNNDFRIEQIENSKEEATALKSFIMEQFIVLKSPWKTIAQKTLHPITWNLFNP